MNLWIPALTAVAVQPLVFIVLLLPEYAFSQQYPIYGMVGLLLAILIFAAAVVLILGIPVFLVLHKFRRESWASLAVTGMLLGAALAAFPWPGPSKGYSAGQNWHGQLVETYIDGTPTTYAWLIYGEHIIFFAIHGLVGALVFFAIWRKRADLSLGAAK